MSALNDSRSEVVAGAASVLGKLGDRQAVPALVALLEKDPHGTGVVAAEALGYLGDTESVEALIRALNGTESELQSGAARALGYIGDERAVSSLIEALGSGDFSLRGIAMDALIGIGEPSLPYLSEALLHSERGVRSGAAECFMQMGYTPKTREEQINLLVANEEWLELTRIGSSAAEVLIHFTDDANEEVRAGAVTALGKVGGPRAIATLAAILADDNLLVRRKAMGSLAEMGEGIVPVLRKIRETSDSTLQCEAIGQVLERVSRGPGQGKARG
jgi:HEAT repeat protein